MRLMCVGGIDMRIFGIKDNLHMFYLVTSRGSICLFGRIDCKTLHNFLEVFES